MGNGPCKWRTYRCEWEKPGLSYLRERFNGTAPLSNIFVSPRVSGADGSDSLRIVLVSSFCLISHQSEIWKGIAKRMRQTINRLSSFCMLSNYASARRESMRNEESVIGRGFHAWKTPHRAQIRALVITRKIVTPSYQLVSLAYLWTLDWHAFWQLLWYSIITWDLIILLLYCILFQIKIEFERFSEIERKCRTFLIFNYD